jgi:hypothetical protein
MTSDELDMSKETVRKILVQDVGMRKLAAKLVMRNLTEGGGGTKDVSQLCAWPLQNNFRKIIFWIVIIGHEHGVISMIPRPNASPWSGD